MKGIKSGSIYVSWKNLKGNVKDVCINSGQFETICYYQDALLAIMNNMEILERRVKELESKPL